MDCFFRRVGTPPTRRTKTKSRAKHVDACGISFQDRGSTPRASTSLRSELQLAAIRGLRLGKPAQRDCQAVIVLGRRLSRRSEAEADKSLKIISFYLRIHAKCLSSMYISCLMSLQAHTIIQVVRKTCPPGWQNTMREKCRIPPNTSRGAYRRQLHLTPKKRLMHLKPTLSLVLAGSSPNGTSDICSVRTLNTPKSSVASIPLTSMAWFYTQKCSVSSEDSKVAKIGLPLQKRVEPLSSISGFFRCPMFI